MTEERYGIEIVPGSYRMEIIPGVNLGFTEAGLVMDSINAWMTTAVRARIGDFNRLRPVLHYGDYFLEQDKQYLDAGKSGLCDAVMSQSKPEKVAEFDRPVDEYNSELNRIVEQKDAKSVNLFFKRVEGYN